MISSLVTHLWQSTLFAIVAAVLAWALRGNPARVRHWIWMAASLKFLLPFSMLVAVGMRMAPPRIVVRALEIPIVIHELGGRVAGPATPAAPFRFAIPLTALLLAIWARGCGKIVWSWWMRWREMRSTVQSAAVVDMRLPIEVRMAGSLVEPGVFGIFRPVLLLPARIAEGLTPPQLRAIVAHELCHVRRRDNLSAAVHMAVSAIFWFHPLVWWIGARLVEERERACDEEVVRQGNPPETYAAGIVAACKLYLRSPLPCAAGVAGADLKGRIEHILTHGAARELSGGKKLLVAACAAAAIAGPISVGLMTAPVVRGQAPVAGSFEVATVKISPQNARGLTMVPANGRLVLKNMPLDMIIAQAYGVYPYRLVNTPGWAHSARFDIEGKSADAKAARSQLFGMLQGLLIERFHLEAHREKREMPVYSLMIGKNGPKLKQPEHPDGPHGVDYRNGGTVLIGRNASIEELADALTFRMERGVVDKTELTGRYDFRIEFTPDEFVRRFGEDTPAAADPNGTSIFTALEEQIGLKLESGKGPVEMIVIDRVERPTEN